MIFFILLLCTRRLTFHVATFSVYLLNVFNSLPFFFLSSFLHFQNFIHEVPKVFVVIKSFVDGVCAEKSGTFNDGSSLAGSF